MKLMHERAACAALLLSLLVPSIGCDSTQAQTEDPEWPLELASDGARIILYQPEPDALDNDELTARAAVSVQEPPDSDPVFGAVWLAARVATDRDARTVTVLDVKVTRASIPDSEPAREQQLTTLIEGEIPKLHHTFSLDRLEATLDAAEELRSADGIGTDPPKILFATTPTVLVTIDGQPRTEKVEGSDVKRVVNTPFVLLVDPADGSYHLKQDKRWLRAERVQGPWQDEAEPPVAVKAALPPPKVDAQAVDPAPRGDAQVLVATEPTELIVSDGEPQWTPVADADLLYLANSDSDVFLDVPSQQHYVLLSGRWYRSASLDEGDWSYVGADALPESFARIPADSPRADVLAFVAGTEQARDAVLDATVPQTSVIARNGTECRVTYDGEPQFAPIEGTGMRYAVNSPESVIELQGRYYCCQQAVWFTSESPTGPWTVCTSVPPEIYGIPPSCPIYPVTYVHVYDSTPEVVYVGYAPGYTGCYVYGPTIVYGTGWWYPGWYGSVYYPYPCTWGFGAHYDPWGCDWLCGPSFGWGVSPWWFGFGYGWGYPGWWGSGGFHCNHFDVHGHTIQPHPPLPSHPAQVARLRRIQTHAGHNNIYKRGENLARNVDLPASQAAPGSAGRGARVPNDVFVDRDGHVVRRTQSGWEERHADGWRSSERLQGLPSSPGGASGTSAPRAPSATPGSTPRESSPARPGTQPATAPRGAQPDTAPRGAQPDTTPRGAPPPAIAPPGTAPRGAPPPAIAPPGAGPRPAPSAPPGAQPSPARPPREEIDRMGRSRDQGSSRASGFRERAGGGSGGASGSGSGSGSGSAPRPASPRGPRP